MMKKQQTYKESGLVSIFVVIFSALLITIVTISFVSVMIRNQEQATNNDLSNSAYDSALAGVEDAKRLLLIYRQCRNNISYASNCPEVVDLVQNASKPCNMVKRGLIPGTSPTDFTEVAIQSQQSDDKSKALDQAYTCVKVDYFAPDLTGTLDEGESQLIPIESNAAFSKVRISWMKKKDGDSRPLVVQPPSTTAFPKKSEWQTDGTKVKPPVLRAQWIQTHSTFNSAEFDYDADARSDTNTLFLYPTTITSNNSFTSDLRPQHGTIPKEPSRVSCVSNAQYQDGSYACTTLPLALPPPVGGDFRANTFLRLSSFYNTGPTDYRIELFDSTGTPVKVVGPIVDSTGRANDLFRRVKARINFASSEYIQPGIDIDGNLCKNFSVTDNTADYDFDHNCTP